MLVGFSAAGSWASPNKGYRQRHDIHESRGAQTATGLDSDSHFDSHDDEQHRTIVNGVGRKGLKTRTRWTEADGSGRA